MCSQTGSCRSKKRTFKNLPEGEQKSQLKICAAFQNKSDSFLCIRLFQNSKQIIYSSDNYNRMLSGD